MTKFADKKIAIIGTGMIGSSLAVLFTGHGVNTAIYARSEKSQERCTQQYEKFFAALTEKGLVTEKQYQKCREFLHFTGDYKELADAYMVFECASEVLDTKYNIYSELEAALADPMAIVSTTSALSPDDLAAGMERFRDRMVVAHPFFPPHLVPFVEILKSSETPQERAQAVYDFLEAMDRKCVILKKNAPGFIANRLQHALFREAINIVELGIADPRDVDKAAMYSFMPRYTSIGLFEHLDNSGVDLNYNIENYLFKDLSAADCAPKMICDLVEKGELGVKTGKGVYDWSEVDMDDFQRRIGAPYWAYVNWELPE